MKTTEEIKDEISSELERLDNSYDRDILSEDENGEYLTWLRGYQDSINDVRKIVIKIFA